MIEREHRDRKVHALGGEGMVLCNPRDREAAHRAEMGKVLTTTRSAAVTCPACRAILNFRTAPDRSWQEID